MQVNTFLSIRAGVAWWWWCFVCVCVCVFLCFCVFLCVCVMRFLVYHVWFFQTGLCFYPWRWLQWVWYRVNPLPFILPTLTVCAANFWCEMAHVVSSILALLFGHRQGKRLFKDLRVVRRDIARVCNASFFRSLLFHHGLPLRLRILLCLSALLCLLVLTLLSGRVCWELLWEISDVRTDGWASRWAQQGYCMSRILALLERSCFRRTKTPTQLHILEEANAVDWKSEWNRQASISSQ
jgi:hypothetical protein